MTSTGLMSHLSSALVLAGLLALAVGAFRDLAARVIPNSVPLVLLVLGLALRTMDGSLMMGVGIALVMFAVTALLWLRGWIGGGDVKLLAAVSLFVAPANVLPMVTWVAIAGGALAAIYLVGHRVMVAPRLGDAAAHRPGLLARIWRAERWRVARGAALPYGVAIAVGCLASV